jgi:hypothetical protein
MKSFAIHVGVSLALGLVIFVSLLPLITLAQGYESTYRPMVLIPGVTDIAAQEGGAVLVQYVNALYGLAIVVAGMIAVIKLVLAGAKYMMSDSFTSKGQAIEDIKGALLGILIILTAFLILATINPRLTGIDFLPENPAVSDAGDGLGFLFDFGEPPCIGDGTCREEACTSFLDSSCEAACVARNGIYVDGWGVTSSGDSCFITDALIPRGEPIEDYPGWVYCPEVTYNSTSFAVGARQACELWCTSLGGDPYFSLVTGGGFRGRYANQCNLSAGEGTPPPSTGTEEIQVPVP